MLLEMTIVYRLFARNAQCSLDQIFYCMVINQSINQSINFIDERVKNHWHRHKNKHKLHYNKNRYNNKDNYV